MDIWEQNKLLLFIAFAIPGFISLKSYEVLCPSSVKSSSDRLIDAVTYSCINYGILYLPIRWVEASDWQENSECKYYFFTIFVLLIAPFVWALLWKKIRSSDFFQKNAPHPIEKPWDFLFEQRKPYWIKVTLNNGEIIAGRYNSKSFASSAPADEQIYLEETWVLDEDEAFLRKVDRTAGILILSKNISHIELRE